MRPGILLTRPAGAEIDWMFVLLPCSLFNTKIDFLARSPGQTEEVNFLESIRLQPAVHFLCM